MRQPLPTATAIVLVAAGIYLTVNGQSNTTPVGRLVQQLPAAISPVATTTNTAASPQTTQPANPPDGQMAEAQPYSTVSTAGARVAIPYLHVNANVYPVAAEGTPGAATLVPPGNIATLGWWNGQIAATDDHNRIVATLATPAPGQDGTAIITGHVDNAIAGLGALFYLRTLPVGSPITVTGSNNITTSWETTTTPELAPKGQLPAGLGAPGGTPRLALVTCGGPFDRAIGSYTENVVVYAAETPGGSPAHS